MTEEKYKAILKGELELLNKLSTDEEYLYLPSNSLSNIVQLIDLKLSIADRLFHLSNRKEMFKSIDAEAMFEAINDFKVGAL